MAVQQKSTMVPDVLKKWSSQIFANKLHTTLFFDPSDSHQWKQEGERKKNWKGKEKGKREVEGDGEGDEGERQGQGQGREKLFS